jgi:hypothetical protein
MPGYPLSLPSEEKRVIESLKEYISIQGLNPNDFKWVKCDSKFNKQFKVRKIEYIPMKFYYIIDYEYTPPEIFFIFKTETFHSYYSPGEDRISSSKVFGSWMQQLDHVRSWITYINREVESINFLKKITVEGSIPFGRISLKTDNEPLKDDEVENVIKLIEGLKEDIKKLKKSGDISDEQLEYANSQLDFLTENVKKQGKRAWLTMALGVVIQLVLSNIDVGLLNKFWLAIQTAIGEALILLPDIPKPLLG